MAKVLTQKEAFSRIAAVHKNEYEYPDFLYVNSRFPIDIICKIHGPFTQTFDAHVYNKTGCPNCYGNEIITNEVFIKKARGIHGDKYDYKLVEYKDAFTKVDIICPIHGVFDQKPNHHIASEAGCPYCAGKLTTELFIEKSKLIHGDKYCYDSSIFNGCNEWIDVVCLIHGPFSTRATNHLQGRGNCIGCVIAARELPLDEFLRRAKELHNNEYDYSLVCNDYKNSQSKVNIICKIHGPFPQTANAHLYGNGCPNCRTYVSKPETEWLDSLSIAKECRQRTIMIGDKKIKVDAFNPDTNTIYEFYGDYWHGNPDVFNRNLINTRTNPNRSMKELYNNTIKKEKLIKKAGYNLITIWEHDWKLLKRAKQ